MKRNFLLAGLLLGPLPAHAANLDVTVLDAAGRPVRDAVVIVESAAGKPKAPVAFTWPNRVTQQNIQFDPYVLIVPVGAEVGFPNRDKVRHHVYSFSPAKKFELKLYGREEARTVKFDKVGAVALGCNIHDGMRAFVRVVDTPFAAKTNAAGQASLGNLPAGPARLVVWHPYLRAKGNESVTQLALAPAGRNARSVRVNFVKGQ